MSDIKLKLHKVLAGDAADLEIVRDDVTTISHTRDTRTAGDQAEIAVRNLLSERLPNGYSVNHGHIVDKNLNCSRQFDIVICNQLGASALFRTKSGAEYIPYEGVYAVGEVKTKYYASDDETKEPIQKFMADLRHMKQNLSRARTSINQIGFPMGPVIEFGGGLTLADGTAIAGSNSITRNRPYRNPVFSFMVFLDSGNFDFNKMTNVYRENVEEPPCFVCFLDKGFIAYMHVNRHL